MIYTNTTLKCDQSVIEMVPYYTTFLENTTEAYGATLNNVNIEVTMWV